MGVEQGIKQFLEQIYKKYNKPQYINTDPVLFLHTDSESEHELSGLVASGLAYGRVTQIKKSIRKVLDCVSLTPEYLIEANAIHLNKLFSRFKHRFTTGEEMGSLILACKKTYEIHGSLKNCFLSHYKETDGTYIPALTGFVRELRSHYQHKKYSLLPDPEKTSACKRLHLFLRWMIRKDDIDPGPWSDLPTSKLIIPLDIHMHRIAINLGFTKRKNADMKTALEVTSYFKQICPDDPVKYDFALTRIGMSGGKIEAGVDALL